MRMMTNTLLGSLAMAVAIPTAAWAAGFQVNEHNARSTARAGAVAATIDDPSAIFYNPAGLASAKGTQAQVGISLLLPGNEYTGTGPTGNTEVSQPTTTGLVPVPNIYLSREISPKVVFGVGAYAPYGLGNKWDDDWVGRTAVQEISLRTFFITPTIGLKLADEVRVGVSVSLVPSSLYLRRVLGDASGAVLLPGLGTDSGEGTLEMSGSAFGVGANAGVQVTLTDNLRAGFAFKSAVGLDFAGNADFEVPAGYTTSIQANFPDGGITGQLTLPHSFSLGIGWVDGPLTLEVTGNLTLWTSYDELRINFDEQLPTPSSASPKNWKTVPTVRLGGEYQFADNYFARLGFAFDSSPVPNETIDPTLPDNNRVIFALGVGANFDPIKVDVGYMGVLILARDALDTQAFTPGKYSGGLTSVIAASVGLAM